MTKCLRVGAAATLLLDFCGAVPTSSAENGRGVATAVLSQTSSGTCDAEQQPSTRFQATPNHLSGQLANGLRYIVYQGSGDDTAIQLIVKSGSFEDPPGLQDLAHVVEHIVFRGTRKYPGRAMATFLSSRGIDPNSFGGSTGYSATRFFLNAPADAHASPAELIDIFHEIAFEMVIADDAVVTEKKAALVEALSSASSSSIISSISRFQWSLYRSPSNPPDRLGTLLAASANMSSQDVRGYYVRWYRPDNMVVVVASRHDPAIFECAIKRAFGDAQNVGIPARRTPPAIANAGHVDTYVDAQLEGPRLDIMRIAQRPQATNRQAWVRQNLLESLAEQLLNDRWERARAEEGGSELAIRSFLASNFTMASGQRAFVTRVDALGMSINAAATRAVGYLEYVRRVGFSDQEIDQLIANRVANEEGVREALLKYNSSNLALGSLISDNVVSGYRADDLKPADMPDLLRSIDRQEIRSLINEALDFSVQTNLILSDRRAVADAGGILSLVQKRDTAPIAFVERDVEPLMIEQPSRGVPPSSSASINNGDHDARVLRFPNGTRVIVVPADSTQRARVAAFRAGGLGAYDQETRRLLGAMKLYPSKMRLNRLGHPTLDQLIKGSDLSYEMDITDRGSLVEVSGTSGEQVMQLVHMLMSNASVDLPVASNRFDEIAQRISATDDREDVVEFSPPSRRELPLATGDVREVFVDRFKRPGDYTFIVSLPASIDDAVNLTSKYVGTLSDAKSVIPRELFEGARFRAGPLRVKKHWGTPHVATLAIGVSGAGPSDKTTFARLKILREMLALTLVQKWRDEGGFAYAPETSLEVLEGTSPEANSFLLTGRSAMFSADVDKACATALEAMSKLAEGQFDLAFFARAKLNARNNISPIAIGQMSAFEHYLDLEIFGRDRTAVEDAAAIDSVTNNDEFHYFIKSVLDSSRALVTIKAQ